MPELTDEEVGFTKGELGRAVGLIRKDISDLKTDISARPTTRDVGYLETRIKDLEDWQKWAMRVGVPSILVALYNLFNNLEGVLPK